jgi:hypothetical protein
MAISEKLTTLNRLKGFNPAFRLAGDKKGVVNEAQSNYATSDLQKSLCWIAFCKVETEVFFVKIHNPPFAKVLLNHYSYILLFNMLFRYFPC